MRCSRSISLDRALIADVLTDEDPFGGTQIHMRASIWLLRVLRCRRLQPTELRSQVVLVNYVPLIRKLSDQLYPGVSLAI